MNWPNLLGISVGLAMDAFAVSIVAGLTVAPVTPRELGILEYLEYASRSTRLAIPEMTRRGRKTKSR